MAKRSRKRHRRYFRAIRRHRRKDRRLSIIGTAATVGSLFVPQNGGTGGERSFGDHLMQIAQGQESFDANNLQYALGDLMGQYVGYNYKMNRWGVPAATATIIIGGLASKVAGRFGNKYINNVPVIGRYIKF